MAKIIKLIGLASYSSRAFKGVSLTRGKSVRLPDAYADKLLNATSMDRAGETIPAFEQLDDSVVPDFNFCDEPLEVAVVEEAKEEIKEEAKDEAKEEVKEPAPAAPAETKPTPAARTAKASQRKARTAS